MQILGSVLGDRLVVLQTGMVLDFDAHWFGRVHVYTGDGKTKKP